MAGTQQVYDFNSLSDNIDKVFICMAEKYFLKKRFGMGAGCNLEDYKRLEVLDRIYLVDNCELSDFKKCLEEEINILTISYDCTPEFGCATCN